MRMTRSRNFLAALVLALTAPGARLAAAEKSLPAFNLDTVKVSGLPNLPDARIPAVPPPTDTGYYSPAGVRMDSSVTVVVDGGGGRVEIELPATGPQGGAGYRSSLFIKLAGRGASPVLSWAAVVCCGGQYLGYKGASLTLPGESGEFSLHDDNYALGPMKGLLGRTHPWLLAGAGPEADGDLNRLCSPEFAGRMKPYLLKALPGSVAGFDIKLNPSRKKLTVTWDKARR